MVLHIYHATVGEKEFQCSTEISKLTPELYEADVRKLIDEVSFTILAQLTGADAMCFACKTARATQLLHHTMLFAEVFPPRVEDMPQPLCNSEECKAAANALHMMNLEEVITAQGRPSPNGCFHCHKGANVVEMAAPLLRCSRCKVAKYCTAKCQKADWRAHKHVCSLGSKLPEGTT